MLCEKYFNISNSQEYSPYVRFMAFQSYLTLPHLFKQLNDLNLSFDNKIVLDLGSGSGVIPCLINERNPKRILAVDTDLEIMSSGLFLSEDKRVNFICGNGFNIPLRDNSVDLVFARYVFQHVNVAPDFLNEIKRVLKPGGRLVIIDIDDGLNLFYPVLPEYSRKLFEVYCDYQKLNGGDRFISRKLPSFFSGNGFAEISVKPYTTTYFKTGASNFNYGEIKTPFLLIQKELGLVMEDIVNKKLMRASEFHKGLNDFYIFLTSPEPLFVSKTEFVIEAINEK